MPANLATLDPAAAAFFPRIAADCIVVDGKRLSNANVAISISSVHTLEERTAGTSPDHVAAMPLTSPDWLRWGAARAVLADLVEQQARADHIQVPDAQVQADVANCRQAEKTMHMSSPCPADEFRRDLANKAEDQRIRANGQTLEQWFAAQLPKHKIYVRGYDVAVAQLPADSARPPGCNRTMGC